MSCWAVVEGVYFSAVWNWRFIHYGTAEWHTWVHVASRMRRHNPKITHSEL